jgi:rfaE bifunctional protein nucleotidyltransferase chain/domain
MTIPSHIGFLQFDICSNPPANLQTIDQHLTASSLPRGTLIVLPELWYAGFNYDTLDVQIEETPAILEKLQNLCERQHIILAGSLPAQQTDGITNTLYIVDHSGVIGEFSKQHLFPPMAEDQHFTPASSLQAAYTPHGILAGLICYDLRFPEVARQQIQQGAELLIVCGQWPKTRIEHWRTLLQARAIENQVHVIGCNRTGITQGTEFGGHSMLIDPNGIILAEGGEQLQLSHIKTDRQTRQTPFNTVGSKPWRRADRNKIYHLSDLIPTIEQARTSGQKVVFTNGCFDLLHEGHVTYLEAARKQGDCLIIGLNSDLSIRSLKGPNRPVNKETSRARLLAALGCVDYVVIFNDDTPLKLITSLKPDVLIKGADWPIDRIVGGKEVLAGGGEVKTIQFVGDFSTTGLIEQIRKK